MGIFFTARIAIKVVGIGHNGFFKFYTNYQSLLKCSDRPKSAWSQIGDSCKLRRVSWPQDFEPDTSDSYGAVTFVTVLGAVTFELRNILWVGVTFVTLLLSHGGVTFVTLFAQFENI